jgi:hypothetical protein
VKVYISGPIEKDPDHAEKFAAAFVEISRAGHNPVSPVDTGRALKYRMGREPTWQEYMREDIKALMDCDGIFMLDGWNRSKGARVEKELAEELEIKQITLERNNNGNEKSL